MKLRRSPLSLPLGAVQPSHELIRMLYTFRRFLLGLVCVLSLSAEGTRELMNGNCNNHGYIQIWDNADPLRNFATYDCPEYARLYIRVAGGERIYMGFHIVTDAGNNPNTIATDVWMRVRDPNENIVLGPIQITSTMTSGWIQNCNQAMIGPSALFPGGYNALIYDVPAGPGGNYYIEFAINNNPNIRQKRVFRWFDITVARWNGNAWIERRGRLWSRKWDLTTRGATNPFVGTLYTYSLDSVVTSFDFNGMQPWGFEVSCNSFGASTVGTAQERRRSDYRQNIINAGGIPAAPEYPVFLNDPDPEFYPTGSVGSVDSFSVIPCTQRSYCIYVSLTKGGQVSVTLNFPPPFVSRTFIQNLNRGPNCIEWDGRDGHGTPIPNNTLVTAQLDFFTGLTHLPLVDVEHHPNGFRVFLVRPTTRPNNTPLPDPLVYWDDGLITTGNALDGLQNFTGCQPTPGQGCHRWRNRGTNNTNPEVINTWWYTNTEQHTFLLDLDTVKWRVFSEILNCTGGKGVQVRLRFWHEIPLSSVSWSIATNPPNLLGNVSETTINNNDPQWTEMYLTFPVLTTQNAVTITFQVSAVSSKYPYCEDQSTLYCTILPVVWAEPLRGEVFTGYNQLRWTTGVEAHLRGFWIERSLPGEGFSPIAFIPAQGQGTTYTYRDEGPPPAAYWRYRLRVEELNAPVSYSNVVELIAPKRGWRFHYDPLTQTLTLQGGEEKAQMVEVFSATGALVWQAQHFAGTASLPLSSGMYILRCEGEIFRFLVP